jgi:hypothetical protein
MRLCRGDVPIRSSLLTISSAIGSKLDDVIVASPHWKLCTAILGSAIPYLYFRYEFVLTL